MEARPAGRLDEDFAGRKARVAGTEDEDRRDLTAGRGSTSEELLPGCKARFTEVEDGDFAGCKARVAGVGGPVRQRRPQGKRVGRRGRELGLRHGVIG